MFNTLMSQLPESMWSEDYEAIAINEHAKAFKILRAYGYLAGELIWNFIDFNTVQGMYKTLCIY